MKRGLITWDQVELAPSVFEKRLAVVHGALEDRQLPALMIYSDVLRSNQARFFTNFMPYWNRSLVVIPRGDRPILLCALSPRVYPWIRSVTMFEDIRPAGKLVPALLQVCAERGWTKLGVLDRPRVPHEVYAPLKKSSVATEDVPLSFVDDAELDMRRRAARLARDVLSRELRNGSGLTDYQFSGLLERAFRRAGAEDLRLLFSTGESAPAPARGEKLAEEFSVAVALEYRGHWVKVTRAWTSEAARKALEDRFIATLRAGIGHTENLAGPYPSEMGPGPIFALQVESATDDARLFYGDTCLRDELGAALL